MSSPSQKGNHVSDTDFEDNTPLTEMKCSVCGQFSYDSIVGSYNQKHPAAPGSNKMVPCDTNGGTWVDGVPQ